MKGRGAIMETDICLQEIGVRITELRKRLGWTQEELAENADLTPQFVSYAESGKRAMRPENLLKLSKALNVSADYLLTGDIVDKDLLILSDKLRNLEPAQIRIIENIVDQCNGLFSEKLRPQKSERSFPISKFFISSKFFHII